MSKKVINHLKSDIKTFNKEAAEDKELIKSLKRTSKKKKKAAKKSVKHSSKKAKDKVAKVMHEFKEHALHSGSKKGPVVKKRSQAIAIALSEKRKASKKK